MLAAAEPNLHIRTGQIPEERDESTGDSSEVGNDVLGWLPEFMAINTSPIVDWGLNGAAQAITVCVSSINDAYNEITTWCKNTFLVPYGKTGRDFIDQQTKRISLIKISLPSSYTGSKIRRKSKSMCQESWRENKGRLHPLFLVPLVEWRKNAQDNIQDWLSSLP